MAEDEQETPEGEQETEVPATDEATSEDTTSGEVEVKGDEAASTGEEGPAKDEGDKVVEETAAEENPVPDPWWKEMGYTDEKTAVNSQKEQRAWTTQTSQENAKLKRSEEAYRKFSAGELQTEDIQKYIDDREIQIAKEEQQSTGAAKLYEERTVVAVDAFKLKYPTIVTDENMPALDAFFRASKREAPKDRLAEAVTAFKRIQVQQTQEVMKSIADDTSESPAGKQEKVQKDYWAMSAKDFKKEANKLVMGLHS